MINFGTGPAFTHADASNSDIKGQSVPMLYVGTRGNADSAMYALDVDILANASPTVQNQNLLIYRVTSPDGSLFQSSPTLVTNYSSAAQPGNGGAVFQTAGDSLFQFDATPISNGNTAQAFPTVNTDLMFHTVSAFGSPAVSALDVSDILGNNAVQDWLYVGDSTTGYCRGLSPDRTGLTFTTYLPTQPPGTQGSVTNPEFPLHSHIFDGSAQHPGNTADMTKANPTTGDIPVFEWGQNAYIRISDVVPPNPGGTNDNPALHIPDPDDSNYYYTNGSAVTFSITDVDRTGKAVANAEAATIPSVVLPNTASLPADGFIERTDPGPFQYDPLVDKNNGGYIACYTYAFRNGQGRQNTPGAYRRVIQARQTADRWKIGAAAPESTITLSAVVTAGIQYNKGGTINQTQPTAEPQFGILNPLFLEGYGMPLNQGPGAAVLLSTIGPVSPHGSPLVGNDLQALTNGNYVYNSAPQNAISQGDPTNATLIATEPAKTYVPVTATSSFINHGTTGTNKINIGPVPTYSLYAGDRSALGELFPNMQNGVNVGTDQDLHIATEERSEHWNDPPGTAPGTERINPLPWDDAPRNSGFNGLNASRDYPNIFGYVINQVLHSDKFNNDATIGTIRSVARIADPAFPSTDPINKPLDYVPQQTNSIAVNMSVVKYQPANLMTFQKGGNTYVDGYIAKPKIFVDSNGNGRWDPGEAFREEVFTTGVPVDQKMAIVEDTVDLKKEPAGFGLDMNGFTPPSFGSNAGAFSPYSPYFTQFFRPVTVLNEGNTNLYDVQFDQLIAPAGTGAAMGVGLPFTSESNDTSAVIPAFDSTGITGPRTAPELPYLLRSSLDHDLVGAYGYNPGFASVGFNPIHGATFHKARPGDSLPPTMTVPDVPHDNYQYYANGTPVPFYMPVNLGAAPLLNGSAPAYATKPYIGFAIPVGTPVGTYSQTLRTFENKELGNTWIQAPSYNGQLDGLAVGGGRPLLPFSDPGTTVKVDVTEQRMTNGFQNGLLPYIDQAPVPSVNFLPSAYRDVLINNGTVSGSGAINGLWTTNRAAAGAFNLDAFTLPWKGYFTPASANNSWYGVSTAASAVGQNYMAPSVIRDQELYNPTADQFTSDGLTYVLYSALSGDNRLMISQVDPASGQLTGTPVQVAANTTLPKYGAHGLKFNLQGSTFGQGINNNLWAFWYSGSRGRTSIYYAAGATPGTGTLPTSFKAYGGPGAGSEAKLPIPAGLSSVQDPTASLVWAPLPDNSFNAGSVPVRALEVTYSGTNGDGNADIYTSRYLPYNPKLPNGSTDTSSVLLQLLPTPNIKEVLAPDYINNWWQARDVAWQRGANGGYVNVYVGYPKVPEQPLLYNPGTGAKLYTSRSFDAASHIEVYTGVSIPNSVGTLIPNQVVYVDVDRGRVRFGVPFVKTTNPIVTAEFNATARRITTDSRADTQPSAFVDDAFKENEGGFANAANAAVGNTLVGRVQASRHYYIWRKSGTGTNVTSPTLYFTTQRLTGVLDLGMGPIPIPLNAKSQPNVMITDVTGGASNVLYDPSKPDQAMVDIDWSRGRIYFPTVVYPNGGAGIAMEGRQIKVQLLQSPQPSPIYLVPHWLIEPRYNDTLSTLSDAPGNSGTVGVDRISATDAGETPVLLDTSINESGVSAFLDPFSFGDVHNPATSIKAPHKVWLFWSSTRNGNPDLYFETIAPKFAPTVQ